jgi:polyisoprenoid-binding protein YceI
LIGAAITHSIKGKKYQGVSLLAPILAFGIYVPQLLINPEMEQAEEDLITVQAPNKNNNSDEENAGPKVLPIDDLNGRYTIIKDASKVQFELGKEGARTKGQFKKAGGEFRFSESLETSSVMVLLAMEDFTTFNKMRDESLESEEYFHVAKYPYMRFEGTGFEKIGENTFNVNGTFTMLGESNPVEVTLQRVEVDDKIVFVGSGSLDRTKFGMTPSAAEGNVVDFHYQVELDQK